LTNLYYSCILVLERRKENQKPKGGKEKFKGFNFKN
jgi:hypothetical protein